MASTTCAFCGNPANTLSDDGPVYIIDRTIDAWFQSWENGEHKMEKVEGSAVTYFFCKPEHRVHWLWGM